MILSFLIHFIYSRQNNFDFHYKQSSFYANEESECFYDHLYTTTFVLKSVICFIRCTFKSINSASEGGAIFIDMNYFGTNNIINNCTFIQCNAKSGGAFYFNYKSSQDCTIQIIYSIFDHNSAYSNSGGAIHIFPMQKEGNIEIKQCTFKSNSALYYGGCIYFHRMIYSINKCNFSDNFLMENEKSYSNYGGSIYLLQSESNDGIIESMFTNNTASDGGSIFFKCIYQTNFFLLNCTFINNSVESYGGSISFSIISGTFSIRKCSFLNNTSKWSGKGGSISFSDEKGLTDNLLNISMNKCYFYNNTAYTTVGNSRGGAISIVYGNFITPSNFYSFIENCEFVNNSSVSNRKSYGAAFFVKITKKNVKLKIQNMFSNLSFVKNTAYSFQHSDGAAISLNFDISFFHVFEKFEDCRFNDNKVFSNSSVCGGAIHCSYVFEGYFKNCIFLNNSAETFFNKYNSDFQNSGGAVYLINSNIRFAECSFVNNNCFRSGGAIYSLDSKVKIYKSCFKNNSLFDFGSLFNNNKQGGSCCFMRSITHLNDCEFINNYVIVDNSSSNIFGGAVYSSGKGYFITCKNCSFINNKVLIKKEHKNEFAGSVYLTMGEIINCTFIDNSAFNGCDLMYEKVHNSILTISDCFFNHNLFQNISDVKSLFYFHVNYNGTFPVVFTKNKFFNNIKAYLFDGKILKLNSKLMFRFQNNCVSPFDKEFYKTGEILIYLDNSLEFVSYYSAFESSCYETNSPVASQTIVTATPSASQTIITATPSASQTEQNIITYQTPTESKSNDDNITSNSISEDEVKIFKKLYIFVVALAISQIGIVLLIVVLFILIYKRRNRYDNIEDQEFLFS